MNLLSDEIAAMAAQSSWIRKMFEEGIELKKKYGADNVYDFSLGNPDMPAPGVVGDTLREIAADAGKPFAFGYMPNAGFPDTRDALAELVSREQGVPETGDRIVVTCGAAGGLNVFFRAVLNKGDEVICPAPYFVEYKFYTGNFGGRLVPVPSRSDFSLDLEAMEKACTPATRAFLINSPNNPTGVIYTPEEIAGLAALLRRKSAEYGRTIYLIADEPYRFLNFDGVEIPSVFQAYEASVVIGSFSKSLSLAGERIGYIAVSPALEHAEQLVSGLAMTNRILGFVNAPAIAQKILNRAAGSQADLEAYRKRRNMMAEVLDYAGISYIMPRGAFYFFPRSPVADESVFIRALVREHVLAVPGRGFGMEGCFRLAFCVPEKTITDSADAFKRAVESVR